MKEITVLDDQLTLASSLNENGLPDLESLADSIIDSIRSEA